MPTFFSSSRRWLLTLGSLSPLLLSTPVQAQGGAA